MYESLSQFCSFFATTTTTATHIAPLTLCHVLGNVQRILRLGPILASRTRPANPARLYAVTQKGLGDVRASKQATHKRQRSPSLEHATVRVQARHVEILDFFLYKPRDISPITIETLVASYRLTTFVCLCIIVVAANLCYYVFVIIMQ